MTSAPVFHLGEQGSGIAKHMNLRRREIYVFRFYQIVTIFTYIQLN